MSKARKEMDMWAEEAANLITQLEKGLAPAAKVAEVLRGTSEAISRYGRIVSRLERHIKLTDPATQRIIELEQELAEAKQALAAAELPLKAA